MPQLPLAKLPQRTEHQPDTPEVLSSILTGGNILLFVFFGYPLSKL